MADGLKINLSQNSINEFKAQINQLKTQAEQENVKINVNINDENIRGQIEAIQSVLNALQNNVKPIEINLDTIKAREQLTQIKGTYQDVFNELSKIGNVKFQPIKIDEQGNIQSFIAQLEQIPGLMQKIKFAVSENGQFSFDPNSVITETSNISKLSEQVDKYKKKRQSLLNEIKDTNLVDTSKINEAQKSLDSLNFTNFKSKIIEVDSLMNDVNKSFKNAFNVDQAGRSLNQKLEQLKEQSKYLNSEDITGLQDKVGNAKSLEDIQQLTNQYNVLKQNEKEFSNQAKQDTRDVESTYKSLESQIQKINNIKNGYNGKLDTGNTQYLKLEVQADKLIEKLRQYQNEEKILSTKEISNIQEEINAYKKKANDIEDVTRFVKQQESAVDALKNKFGNLFSNSDVSKLKENLQSVLSLGSLNTNDKDQITNFIANKKKELTELKRVSGLGANVGSLSGSGLGMESSNENLKALNKWVQANIDAKASVSSLGSVEETLNGKVLTANGSIDKGNGIIEKMKINLDTSTDSVYKMSNGVQDLSSRHASLTESMSNALAGFIKFQVGAASIMAVINALKEGISVITDLNTSMTNIAMVTGDGMDKVKQYMNQYTQLSQQLHTTTSDVAIAAEQFLRAGDSQQQSMKMVQAATVMAKETGMTQEEASQGLIAIANSYGILPEKMMQTVDMMTTVDNKSATSVSEINTALQKTASSAKGAGVSLQDLISYIAEISSTTRQSAGTIGTGLNSIFSRYESIKMGKSYDPDNNPLMLGAMVA